MKTKLRSHVSKSQDQILLPKLMKMKESNNFSLIKKTIDMK